MTKVCSTVLNGRKLLREEADAKACEGDALGFGDEIAVEDI